MSTLREDPIEARRCGGAIGLIMMALSAFAFSIMSMLVHLLAAEHSIPSFELVGLRGLFGVTVGLLFFGCWPSAPSITGPSDSRWILVRRCAFGVCGISSNWYVLSQLPLGDATVIIFTAPIFTAVFANIFMGETMTQVEIGLMMFSASGVLLVARPSVLGFEEDTPPSYATSPRGFVFAVGLVGASCSAMTNLLVRQLTDVHAMVTITWLFTSNTLCAPILLMLFRMDPVAPVGVKSWLCVLGVGIVGFAGQGFKTLGLKWEKAGPGTMMRYLDLFFAFLYQYFIFNEPLHTLSVIGAGITLVSSIALGVLKLRQKAEKVRMTPPPMTLSPNQSK